MLRAPYVSMAGRLRNYHSSSSPGVSFGDQSKFLVAGGWAVSFRLNFFGFLLGAIITGVSYVAYRSHNERTSLRNATVGFGLITLGTAVEPIYQLGIVGTHVLASNRNIPLQIFEGSLISLGFLVLFFSVYRYSARTTRQQITVSGVDDGLFDEPD